MKLQFKKSLNIFTAALLLSHSIFSAPPAFSDFSLDDFRGYSVGSGLSSPYSSGFSGKTPLNKQDLTSKEKEAAKLAREDLNRKKILFSNEELIKQIKKNKIENVKLMLNAGISPNADYFGEHALYYAARNKKTDIGLLLLEKGASPNIGFNSPLFWAAKNNDYRLAAALIKNGAKLDYIDLVSSKSILYTTLKAGHIEVARLLLENGAKPDTSSAFLIKKKNLFNKLGIAKF